MLKKLLKTPPIELEMIGTDLIENGQTCIQYAVILPLWLRIFELFTCWKLPVMVKLYHPMIDPFTPLDKLEIQIKERIWQDLLCQSRPFVSEYSIAVLETPGGIQETLTFWWGID